MQNKNRKFFKNTTKKKNCSSPYQHKHYNIETGSFTSFYNSPFHPLLIALLLSLELLLLLFEQLLELLVPLSIITSCWICCNVRFTMCCKMCGLQCPSSHGSTPVVNSAKSFIGKRSNVVNISSVMAVNCHQN